MNEIEYAITNFEEFLEADIGQGDLHMCSAETALSALRSEAEREKGCKYCNDVCALDWQYGLDHILPDYRFCPMCGCELVKRLEVEP
ncbi:MAG: hypothetical protein GX117_05005 [Candidatus Hydrogenedentes bacterium]|nr:hypothetical protein [Candidatus Hydrogenedentota bacterium]